MSVPTGQIDTIAANPVRAIGVPSGTVLAPTRLRRAKKAYTTRSVAARIDGSPRGYTLLDGPDVTPRPGDVVLARIEEIGMHTRLESPVSRRQTLFVGDEVLVAYGHRYAPDQFEAEVPGDLRPVHLVAAGGVAALATAKHARVADPTAVRPLGLLADAHGVVNLDRFAPRRLGAETAPHRTGGRPTVIGVLGTSMNSGKSTTVASLIRGLVRSGLRVTAGKATGTGAGGDPNGFADAGASQVLDFTDFGFPTTFRLAHEQVRAILLSLIDELSVPGIDVVVVEIADGLYQHETSNLVADPVFPRVVDRVVFAADGAAGAVGGVGLLRERGVPVTAVSGVLTSAPLAMREARSVLDVPVIETAALREPDVVRAVL
ncbi:DUF1611 domain-containing protein [Prauserella cavernicola]|uniref:DUF1611 domain-containing protein n=1 Tax=Prauserella cavernicola TaxID=2800127 RepID=A0A934QVI8_9PSEU|nr:DUF1611 domain-containing protein [Prauserella cavernicola]MBK1787220.1 DUF1611 domain-containing protein [Prauserella cavernicola]